MKSFQPQPRLKSPGEVGHPPTILLAVTVDQSLKLMHGFPAYLSSRGWNVHVVSSGDTLEAPTYFVGPAGQTQFHALTMMREPAPGRDLPALIRWIVLMRRIRPDIVCIGTPKASLLGLTAAALTGVPSRNYLLRGLRLEGEQGRRRKLLVLLERFTSRMAHHVISVSPSLGAVATENRIGTPTKNLTLGAGSSNGIRVPSSNDQIDKADLAKLRTELGLDPITPVIGFVGRLTPDKGLDDLFDAASLVSDRGQPFQLLIVGAEDEPGYLVHLKQRARSLSVPCVFTGYVAQPDGMYAAMNLFVLPSRREGMPNVSLEAAACGIPVLTTDATGCVDSVVSGVTGYTYRTGHADELADRIFRLLSKPMASEQMGRAGRDWAHKWFSQATVWNFYEQFFLMQLGLKDAYSVQKSP